MTKQTNKECQNLHQNLHIFRTDIKTKKKVKSIKPVLDNIPNIRGWSIDLEDIDNVLRIEFRNDLAANEVILLVKTYGFYCEELED